MRIFGKAHPYLFTLASLIFVYPVTAVIASPGQVMRTLVLLLIILAIVSILVYRFVNDKHWGAVLLSVFVLGFFATKLFFYVAGLISGVVIVLWWLISIIRKRAFRVEQVTVLLNVTSTLLLLLSVIRAVPLFRQVSWSTYRQGIASARDSLKIAPIVPNSKPDIYYIVLDGYARADVLDEFYNYDNSGFIDELENRGFIIPTNSHSNYPKTALSISSTLNMDYISSKDFGIEDSVFWWLMSPLIDRSQTRRILEGAGYQTVSIATDWGITDNPTTDEYLKPYPIHLNDFEGYMLSQSPLGLLKPLIKGVADVPSFRMHGQFVKFDFEKLSEIPNNPNPTFTFAHIISPHPPFVFDKDGNILSPDYNYSFNDANDFPGTDEEYRQNYIAQVQFVNRQLIALVDSILEKSHTPPIIVFQADHGPGMLTDFRSSENTCLKERFSVFAAYYLPGVDKNVVPADISDVNIFRIVFNQYFGADFPLLENKMYYYKDTIYIYRSEDVTSQLDRACTK